MPDVIALGDVNVDIIARVARFPSKGEDALAQSTQFHCGGSAANASIALARLGLRVALIARIGQDPWAAVAFRSLEQAGVLLDCLQVDPDVMTGLMYILVTPDGERTILGDRGANALTLPEPTQEQTIRHARLLHLSGYAFLTEPQRSTALRAAELARLHGLTISLDPGLAISQDAVDQMRPLLPTVELLLPTVAEARALTGSTNPEDCAQALLELGVGTVALKLGRGGCLIATREHAIQMPAFDVAVRDSTGAGDSFAAGIIAAFLGGLDWTSAAALGNALGAATASQMGAEPSDSLVDGALALLRKAPDRCAVNGFRDARTHSDALAQAANYLDSLSSGDAGLTQ